jgi:hypothetical protein
MVPRTRKIAGIAMLDGRGVEKALRSPPQQNNVRKSGASRHQTARHIRIADQ